MKYFNEHRRRLIKSHHIRGTKATITSDTGEATLESGVGVKSIEIKGNTVQESIPIPSEPVAIQNTGENSLEVKIRGANLFDALKAELKNCTYENGAFTALTASCSVDIQLTPGKYTISCTKSEGFDIYLRNGKIESGYFSKITKDRDYFTFDFTGSYDGYLRLSWFVVGGSLFNIQIVNGSEVKPYEPYIKPYVLTIPTALCGIGDYKDTLALDWENKTIKKHSKIELYTFTGDEEITDVSLGEDSAYMVALDKKSNNFPSLCTHFPFYSSEQEKTPSFDFYLGGNACFYYVEQSTKEEFAQWLKGNNVQIAYVLKNEAVEDIDMELLELIVPYGMNAILEVSNASEIGATYYSLEEEDKLSLTVHYVDSDGNSLRESEIHHIRRDSGYTLVSPSLDGYEPVKSKYEGVLTENNEITLVYKEK